MKKDFFVTAALLFLFVNEYLAKYILALLVGELGLAQSFEKTFQHTTFSSYFYSASFRVIPYAALAIIAAKTNVSKIRSGQIALWVALVLITAFHFYGYWGMQHTLFTSERMSSTSGLALIFIPIWSFVFCALFFTIWALSSKAYRLYQRGA